MPCNTLSMPNMPFFRFDFSRSTFVSMLDRIRNMGLLELVTFEFDYFVVACLFQFHIDAFFAIQSPYPVFLSAFWCTPSIAPSSVEELLVLLFHHRVWPLARQFLTAFSQYACRLARHRLSFEQVGKSGTEYQGRQMARLRLNTLHWYKKFRNMVFWTSNYLFSTYWVYDSGTFWIT